jgi:hypothetical protein
MPWAAARPPPIDVAKYTIGRTAVKRLFVRGRAGPLGAAGRKTHAMRHVNFVSDKKVDFRLPTADD